jgi:ABC-type bacteriocin/lantibiotic exporter with double-glycine peptidase domain
VEKLIRGLEAFYDLLTSLEKLGQVVDKELEDQDNEKPFTEDTDLTVELEHVAFGARGRETILDDISLKIMPRSNTLIVGANGSGKSTLLRVIAGLIEPTQGNIYINDISLKGINANHYRSFLGQSLTEDSPFEGTILENITFGDTDISQKDLHWALEKTGLLAFVKSQSKGLNTMLYPEGLQIPHTVGKKIVLARSIVRKPKILILKDPLHWFDEVEAMVIIKFLTDKSNPWALVVVSQDQKWLGHCDRILTMENGNIVSEN